MEDNNQNQTTEELKKKNNLLYIIIGILSLVLISFAIYLFTSKKEDKKEEIAEKTLNKDSISSNLSNSSKDTLNVKMISDEGEDYEEYEKYTESYVIGSEVFLRDAPSKDANKVKSLFFGNKLYVKDYYDDKDYYTVYLTKPVNEKNPTEQSYYVLSSTIVTSDEFNQFKTSFSLDPYSKLDSKVKKLILDENYSESVNYEVSQNSDRVKNTICFGDFDQDNLRDVVVILDNNEKQYSRLLVICNNKGSNEPYLAYAENFDDKVLINSFKKGAKIFDGTSDDLVSSPRDGVILNTESSKYVIMYDPKYQKFKSFAQ